MAHVAWQTAKSIQYLESFFGFPEIRSSFVSDYPIKPERTVLPCLRRLSAISNARRGILGKPGKIEVMSEK